MPDTQESFSVDEAVKALTTQEETSQSEEIVEDDQTSEQETIPNEVEDQEEQVAQEEDNEEDFQSEASEDSDQEDYVELADGEKVTLSELLNGYERQSDYTRKTQAVAEQRKAVEAEQVKYQERMETFASKTSELDGLMQVLLGEEQQSKVDLLELAQDDPSEYVRQRALMDAKQAKIDEAKAKVDEARQELLKDQEEQFVGYMQTQLDQLHERIPEWRDDTVRQAKQTEILKKAQEKYGFSAEELQITDHRHWLLLQDAVLGSSMKDKKPALEKRIKKAPKLIKVNGEKPKSQLKQESIQQRKGKLKTAKGRNATLEAAKLIQEMGIV